MTTRPRFEANDGVVVLINGTAKVDVLENCFTQNGRTQVIEFQSAVGKPVKAKIVPLLKTCRLGMMAVFGGVYDLSYFLGFLCLKTNSPFQVQEKNG